MKHADILKKMTLEEKASLCSGRDYWNTAAVESVGIPSIMLTDGPHGIRKREKEKTKEQQKSLMGVPAICFPTAATTSCSWDPDLLKKMGKTLGEECLKEQVSVLLGPGSNIKRSPLCGRNFEYFSEDPYLAGQCASAFIDGVQSKGIGTSMKHFAANSQETRRMTVNSVVDERALREIYLTAFEIAVKQSQPWTIMNAYNRLNGEYCSENKWLLTDVLRDEWGYKGIVMTDWGAENERVPGLLAGQELEMPSSNGMGNRQIVAAVKSGLVKESYLDELCDRMIDLALKACKVRGSNYTYDADKHHEIARSIAEQSMVLLRNEDHILPLNKKQSIAVIGEMAKSPRYQGAGSSLLNPIKLDNAFDSILDMGAKVQYAAGYDKKKPEADLALLDEAVRIAKTSDVALLFLGLTEDFESEGYDRHHLSIPKAHIDLLNAVAAVNENVVVVLSGGSAIEMPWLSKTKAVLHSFLSGQASGSATVNLLFGKVNPSGKLSETYPIKLEDNPSYENFPGSPVTVEYRESVYVGYRYYDTAKKDVLFPFGFGLSYTDFKYSGLKLSKKKIKDTDTLTVTFKVKNVGKVAGAEIAELYVRDEESTIYRPEKELRAFQKVFLKPGEEKEISLELTKRAFAYYNVLLKDWHVESGKFDILVGASSRDIRLEGTVDVTSTVECEIPDYRKSAPDYYTANVHEITAEEFTAVYGKELPASERPAGQKLDLNSTLEDAKATVWGGRIVKVIESGIKAAFKESESQMATAVALQTPIRDFIAMSMGVFSPKMADGLLMILNDESFPKGLWKIVSCLLDVIKNLGPLLNSI